RIPHLLARDRGVVRPKFIMDADAYAVVVPEAEGPVLHGVVVVRRRVEVFGHVANVVGGDETFVGEAAVPFWEAVGVVLLDAGGDEAGEKEGEEGEKGGGGEQKHFVENRIGRRLRIKGTANISIKCV
ncbi:MAG: hypothetical protein Q9198_010547, partial [Flavoplaca austrocitrina]